MACSCAREYNFLSKKKEILKQDATRQKLTVLRSQILKKKKGHRQCDSSIQGTLCCIIKFRDTETETNIMLIRAKGEEDMVSCRLMVTRFWFYRENKKKWS